jgi:outer membrane protein TolC
MSRKSVSFLLFSLLIARTVSDAQQVSTPDSALQAILGSLHGSPLSLRKAVDLALTNAVSVRKAEAAYNAAEGSVRREAGAFDPELFLTLNHMDQRQPTASFFAGAPILATQQTTSQSGLRMKLPVGTEIELSLNTSRLITNSAFAFLTPEYDVFGSLSFRQPLLGGLSVSARKQLNRAEEELDAEKARYDQQKIAVDNDVEQLYWDLYAAERDYAVQRLTRDRAEAFLKETELRSSAGLVGPNQVANAKTFLAQQELQLIEREEQLDRQSDRLAALIGARPGNGTSRFIVTDEPPDNYPADNVEVLVEQALKANLDLQATGHTIEAARTVADAAGWEALPSVNLLGSLGGNGLGGTNQPVIFGTDTLRISGSGSFSQAISQVTRRQFPNWNIGVEVNFPIGLRSGNGEKERLEAQVLSAQQVYIEQSRNLEEQVRTAYREVSHGKSRIAAARAGVDAAQEQVRIGLIEFHNGRLTAFELTRLGEDFAVAQQRFSEALVRTAKAAATLRQLTSGGYSTSLH